MDPDAFGSGRHTCRNRELKRRVMKIDKIFGRELFNAAGVPTLSCEIVLEDGTFVSASIPSDPLTEQEGFFVLRDGGSRCKGQGLLKAIYNIESIVAPALIGKIPEVHVGDALLAELDGTAQRSKLGANVTLAVSMAMCKAQAAVEELELFEVIAQLQGSASVSLPFPLLTIANGGNILQNGLYFQGILLVPVGAENFRTALEYALQVFHTYQALLIADKKAVGITESGGIFSTYADTFESFEYVTKALKLTGLESSFVIGVDAGADRLYDAFSQTYTWGNEQKTATQLIEVYRRLCDSYPLYSLENGLSWQDVEGGRKLYEALGSAIQLASNDGFSHSATLLQGLDAQRVTNASVIRLAGVSTVTELLESVQFAQTHGLNTIIACSAGETEETFLADVAVGTSSGQIQAGGGSRSEFLAKYNRLLFIEDLLASELLNRA